MICNYNRGNFDAINQEFAKFTDHFLDAFGDKSVDKCEKLVRLFQFTNLPAKDLLLTIAPFL